MSLWWDNQRHHISVFMAIRIRCASNIYLSLDPQVSTKVSKYSSECWWNPPSFPISWIAEYNSVQLCSKTGEYQTHVFLQSITIKLFEMQNYVSVAG